MPEVVGSNPTFAITQKNGKTMSSDDIEKTLRDLVKLAEQDPRASGVNLDCLRVREILDRLAEYRTRFADRANKHHTDISRLQSKHDYMSGLLGRARRRLDHDGLHASESDAAEVAALIERLDSIRGRVITSRLMWGKAMPPDIAQETIGVLRAAIADANETRREYYKKTREVQQKRRAEQIENAKKAAKLVIQEVTELATPPEGNEESGSLFKKFKSFFSQTT